MSTPKVFIGAASERDALVAAFKRVLDYPPGELVARSWRDVFDEAGAGKTTIECSRMQPRTTTSASFC